VACLNSENAFVLVFGYDYATQLERIDVSDSGSLHGKVGCVVIYAQSR